MSSRRFPGKALATIGSRLLLEWVVDSLGYCRAIEGVLIATSTHPSDDPISDWCLGKGQHVVRGPLNDVLARTLMAADVVDADVIVRINGDSPFIFPPIIDSLVEVFHQQPRDIVTNVSPRTFPKGQSVEVINVDSLRAASLSISDLNDREHVTTGMYANPNIWDVANLTMINLFPDAASEDLSNFSLCLDEPSDLLFLEAFLDALGQDCPWSATWRQYESALTRLVEGA